MAIDQKVLEKLFEGFDQKLLSDDLREKVKEMLEDTVNARVEAHIKDYEEKEKLALEEVEKVKKEYSEKESQLAEEYAAKEKILEDEATAFAESVAKKLAEQENVMQEEVEEYRKHVEQIVAEEASNYRDYLENVITEEAENYRNHIEEVALNEAINYRKQQEAALAEEVGTFKKDMVEKISDFFESELTKNIPEEIMEAATKLSAYEPLVEKMIGVFGESYIKLDTTSYDVITEARKENEKLSETVNSKVKEVVRLQKEINNLRSENKIASLTEGMTPTQKTKAKELLEGYSPDEIEGKFEKVKDIIIEKSIKESDDKVERKSESKSKKVLSETARKKIEKLQSRSMNESADPDMDEYVQRLKRQIGS